ncbi:hypothetical protein LEP1GSC017_1101 [Leptospira meyeri serovar Hardjo str. Went 5]|nr:hypothetical protein LEP1GSC017_1101 [Leptospira meyeri serovar Hardjo str. Went 5]EMJ88127.1 hypothetical protein LEP1GSC196_2307 [Leptospira meyeri serovar Semaranga str. Veldrot Semarang 173]
MKRRIDRQTFSFFPLHSITKISIKDPGPSTFLLLLSQFT